MRPRIVAALLAVVLLGTGCLKASSELLPVSLYEGYVPDGALSGTVAYVEQTSIDDTKVVLMDVSDRGTSTVGLPKGWTEDVAFSPAGTALAYAHGPSEGDTQIWLSAADGSGAHQLTHYGHQLEDPAWSPDGKTLAGAEFTGSDWRLVTINVSSGDVHILSAPGDQQRFPTWESDGTTIVYSARDGDDGHYKLWSYDLATGRSSRLTSGTGDDMYPKAGPDGAIVFASSRSGGWQTYIRASDGQIHTVVPSNSVEQWPAWSPDGRYVVVSVPHLGVYRADGAKLPKGLLRWRLTKLPAWSASWRAG